MTLIPDAAELRIGLERLGQAILDAKRLEMAVRLLQNGYQTKECWEVVKELLFRKAKLTHDGDET